MEEKLLADASRDADDQASPRPGDVVEALITLIIVALSIVLTVVTVVSLGRCLFVDCSSPNRAPEISVVVDGCSALDGARVPRAFNLTITVDNPDATTRVCIGGVAEVLYAGVPLAAGAVAEDLCVPPRGAGTVAARAASGGIGLPGELARTMEEERRAAGGVARVEVRAFSVERRVSLKCVVGVPGTAGAASLPSPCDRRVLTDESDGLVKPTNPN